MATQKRRKEDEYMGDEATVYSLDKRIALIDQTVIRLAVDLEKINNNINRLIWVIGTAIGLAVMKFILSGGLNAIP